MRAFSEWASRYQDAGDVAPVWGAPNCLRSDNGSEGVTRQVKKWLLKHATGTCYIDPVSPWQIHFIESFNSIFRTTFLNRWCFFDIGGDEISHPAVAGGVQRDSSTRILSEVYQQNEVTGKPNSGSRLKNLGWSPAQWRKPPTCRMSYGSALPSDWLLVLRSTLQSSNSRR